MANFKTYSAALIGCGRIGYSLGLDKKREQPASHTMALLANSKIDLLAACDTNPQNLQKWHDAYKKLAVYNDSASLYIRQKPEIITIAVNENAHLKETLAAINQNPRLIILEKPVALNMNEAQLINSAAFLNKVPILVNHERRFSEDFNLAKKYMSQIGDLQSINASLYSSLAVYDPNQEQTGAYSLIHDGTHLVDAVLFFLEDENNFSQTKEISVFDTSKFADFNSDSNADFKNENFNSKTSSSASLSSGNFTSNLNADFSKTSAELSKSQNTQNQNPQNQKRGLLNKVLSFKTLPKKTKFINDILNSPKITGIFRDEKNCVRQFTANYSTKKCPSVSISMSGRSKFFGFEITITGTQGRICIGNGYLKLYKREESSLYTGFYSLSNDKSQKLPKKTLYFSNMIQNAVDFLDGKCELKSTLQTGINALAVLEEIKDLIK